MSRSVLKNSTGLHTMGVRCYIAIAITCVGLGCSSPTGSFRDVRMFVVNRGPLRNSNLLFNPTPSAVDPALFVRKDWPSTPHTWAVTSEEVRWREIVRDYQGDSYYGRHGRDHYHRVFRSDRRGRAVR